jgi:iron complex outermembrane receptor protein
VNGVVSGSAINTFDGSVIGPLTIDSRTLTTNYNVADNATGAQELWLRGGFEWQPLNNVTIKDQIYSYQAKRNWLDSETYAFSLTSVAMPCPGLQPTCIARDRFAVFHNQNIFGNNADLTWDSPLFGMENRFAAQLQTSSNRITFKEDISEPFPDDTVGVINPQPGLYGPLSLSTRNSTLDDIAGSFEDRLKLTPAFALIGGVRVERLTLSRDGVNADGTIPSGLPFSVSWEPVSCRAAYTYEPIRDLMFYSTYATAYNPAVAAVFSITPGTRCS